MFSVLAAHACSWIIARLGTEIAVCGHDPMEQADTWGKNKKKARPWAMCHCIESRSTIHF